MNYPIIWDKQSFKNQWVCFRKKFVWNDKTAILLAAVESKYVLYVNGKMVVFDGGLNRGPDRNSGYYDEVDITSYLHSGENTLAFLVWYWGNEGRCNFDSGVPGLSFVVLRDNEPLCSSSDDVKCCTHPCYGQSVPPLPSYLYGGDNITYYADPAWTSWYQPEFDDSAWPMAMVQQGSWGKLEKRPIPQFYFSQIRPYEKVAQDGEYYICDLPKAAHVSPYLKVIAEQGERIDIRTDRYEVHGGPGDSHHVYNSQRVDYFAAEGEQEFLALYWYFGEKVIYHIPAGVQVLELGYMESGYDCQVMSHYTGKNAFEQRLIEKCINTLRVCMRDNFMDCPDRERGQWIGDVSVQAPQVFAVLDDRAVLLMKKAIHDFIRMRKGAVLQGNVPGVCASELPSQSLVSIGKYGMIAEYYRHTRDKETLSLCYQPMVNYLKLWKLDERGLVQPRAGDWYWFDHLESIDALVLENCIYYSALDFIRETAQTLDETEDLDWVKERMRTIRRAVRENFLQEEGYGSSAEPDERANAWAVLSGIAEVQEYERIRRVIMTCCECTPYMEYFVLMALKKMGYDQDAYERMVKRYTPLVENENSTLWEDFNILGTRNHAWSGGALMLLCREE